MILLQPEVLAGLLGRNPVRHCGCYGFMQRPTAAYKIDHHFLSSIIKNIKHQGTINLFLHFKGKAQREPPPTKCTWWLHRKSIGLSLCCTLLCHLSKSRWRKQHPALTGPRAPPGSPQSIISTVAPVYLTFHLVGGNRTLGLSCLSR